MLLLYFLLPKRNSLSKVLLLNNQLLYLCLMGDGEKAKEVVLDSTTVEKGKFSFSGVHQMPDIAIIKDMDGETYPLIFEKGEIFINK